MHELATNAAKYGSLSKSTGRIEISWHADTSGKLSLQWKERGGPRIAEPTRIGFGVGAVDGVIRMLSGSIDREWKPEGLVCELSFPPVAA